MATADTLVRRFFDEVLTQGKEASARELLAPDFVAHHPNVPGGVIRGVEEMLDTVGMFHAGFPDLRYSVVDDSLTDGSRVAVRWSASGTHDGAFLGVPATHRRVDGISGTDIFRIENGKIAETWVSSDLFGLFQQLGKFPPPPA